MKFKLIIIILFVFLNSCSKNGTEPPKPSLDILVEDGWNLFKEADYAGAIGKFSDAISFYNDKALKAYTGRGWSYSRVAFGMNDDNYENAISDFKKAISLDSELPDSRAGISFVYLIKNEYSKAINMAESVIRDFPNYTFRYDSTINVIDLRILLAQAFYYNGVYDKSAEQLDIIEPGVEHPYEDPEILLTQIQNISLTYRN